MRSGTIPIDMARCTVHGTPMNTTTFHVGDRVIYDTHGYSDRDGTPVTVVQVGYRWGGSGQQVDRPDLIVVQFPSRSIVTVVEDGSLTLDKHAWVGPTGEEWTPEAESDKCDVCGRTPDSHPGLIA